MSQMSGLDGKLKSLGSAKYAMVVNFDPREIRFGTHVVVYTTDDYRVGRIAFHGNSLMWQETSQLGWPDEPYPMGEVIRQAVEQGLVQRRSLDEWVEPEGRRIGTGVTYADDQCGILSGAAAVSGEAEKQRRNQQ